MCVELLLFTSRSASTSTLDGKVIAHFADSPTDDAKMEIGRDGGIRFTKLFF